MDEELRSEIGRMVANIKERVAGSGTASTRINPVRFAESGLHLTLHRKWKDQQGNCALCGGAIELECDNKMLVCSPESNVRKTFNRLLDAAELHRRGPHQMRHSFASLLLQDGAPITYVSRQLGHKHASITLRVYAHWLPDPMSAKLVNALDDTSPRITQASPARRMKTFRKRQVVWNQW